MGQTRTTNRDSPSLATYFMAVSTTLSIALHSGGVRAGRGERAPGVPNSTMGVAAAAAAALPPVCAARGVPISDTVGVNPIAMRATAIRCFRAVATHSGACMARRIVKVAGSGCPWDFKLVLPGDAMVYEVGAHGINYMA